MQFTVTGRNIAVTPALRNYAESKLVRLHRFVDALGTAHVVLSVEKHRQVAEVTLTVRDLILRAEESTPDLYASIDLVAAKLERQVLRYKEKLVAHGGRGGRGSVAAARGAGVAVEEEGPGAEPRVVRVKRFALKPLAVEDAVVQMELLGHTFFVFRNARSEEVNVIYRRQDGTYGLIEPEG
ncbi:MAG TPA: ribosome-associated translation inhibitor RaiA [Candidatus Methylomirabilis sp.]|jgi:putative sigma-54 modulation protein